MAGNHFHETEQLRRIWSAHRSNEFLDGRPSIEKISVRIKLFSFDGALNSSHSSNSDFKIRMGDWDTSARNEPLDFEEYDVAKVTYHRDYKPASLKNSIAVLRLASKVPLGRLPTISTACLPG